MPSFPESQSSPLSAVPVSHVYPLLCPFPWPCLFISSSLHLKRMEHEHQKQGVLWDRLRNQKRSYLQLVLT